MKKIIAIMLLSTWFSVFAAEEAPKGACVLIKNSQSMIESVCNQANTVIETQARLKASQCQMQGSSTGDCAAGTIIDR